LAIRQKTVVTQKMSADCPSHSMSNVAVRDVSMVIDEPEARGGTNLGLTPTETAIASLLGCTNVIANKCADKLNIDIGHLKIDVSYDFDRRGATLSEEIDLPFPKLVLTVTSGGSATDAELQQVAAEVNKYCPISKLFKQAGAV